MKLLTKENFVDSALQFKQEMTKPRTLDELHNLWRSTAFPYRLESSDPYSDIYKDEIRTLYELLCGKTYSVTNEMTSVLQTPEDFKTGYPWVSQNLRVVSSELGKAVSSLHAISRYSPNANTFIEFGSGWGNLAIPLARSGMEVTAIDIDPGFLNRMNTEALALGVTIKSIQSDFLNAVNILNGRKFDCVIFCSSLHHCLDFKELLANIRDHVLNPGGAIFFFAEPILPDLAFPWGLRYDGESLWAITCNNWLELGFSETFFIDLFSRLNMSLIEINDETGLCGRSWVARS